MSAVILGTVAAGLSLIKRLDKEITVSRRAAAGIIAAAAVGSCLLRWLCGREELLPRLLLSMVLGCLLLACVTDIAMCQVYNFVWWISCTLAGALLLYRWIGMGAVKGVLELLLFCVAQLLIFSGLYGRADCYAFCVCAGAEAGLGMGMEAFLAHMVIAFALLLPVQAVKKNITAGGRLKTPVPFLPYVTTGFAVILIFHKIYGETVVPLS